MQIRYRPWSISCFTAKTTWFYSKNKSHADNNRLWLAKLTTKAVVCSIKNEQFNFS